MKFITIFESNDYLIRYYGQGGSVCFVTFNTAGSTKASKEFGLDFCLKNSFDMITVVHENDTQYQGLSRSFFYSLVAHILQGYKDVVFYGSSLGGYCALYYGSSFDCKIIASAPKNSAHPDFLIPKHNSLEYKHDLKIATCNNPAFIVFDPRRSADKKFVDLMVKPSFLNASYFEVPFAGHKALHYVKDVGVLKRFILSVVEGKGGGDIPANVQTDRYLYNKAYYFFRKKDYQRALKVLSNVKLKSVEVEGLEDKIKRSMFV